jgi:hypothetical protein
MDNHIFDNPDFEHYTPDALRNYELLLQDEFFIEEYKSSITNQNNGGKWKPFGYVSFVAVKRVTAKIVELSFFPITSDRLHELTIVLPRDQIVTCVRAWQWDDRPTLFVKSRWLKKTLARFNCVFGLIDAIGVRNVLETGVALNDSLLKLRSGLDAIASRYPQVSFVSFADSVLLKCHWSLGVKCTYDPEMMLYLFTEIRALFKESLGLAIYGVFTQGSNEYYADTAMHVSKKIKNHVCLNSLGSPFADLKSIDEVARQVYKENPVHYDLYLDELYFKSLRLNSKFKQSVSDWNSYTMCISKTRGWYARVLCDEILKNLTPARQKLLTGSPRVAR